MTRGGVPQFRKTGCSRYLRGLNPDCHPPSSPSSPALVISVLFGSGSQVDAIWLARSKDQSFALGRVNEEGELLTYNVGWMPNAIGHIELAHEYLERIADLIDGEVRKTANPGQWYVAFEGAPSAPPD